MPLRSSIAGTSSEPARSEIDARWSMAYAAALGETDARYFDTRAGIVAHPLFPVCFEWPVLVAMRAQAAGAGLRPDEAMRGVHATHDLLLARALRPPERLVTRLVVVGIQRTRAGAFQLTRLDTADASGAPVCTSWYGTVYRGVEVEGPDRLAADAPVPPEAPQPATVPVEIDFPVPGGLAHIYSECARIWNPIHTDAGVAERAGLPAIILHGTATLALAVSRIVAAEAGADPERVARVAGRFAAMVLMPSELKVRIIARARGVGGTGVFFEVLNDAGKPAIRDGFVGLRA